MLARMFGVFRDNQGEKGIRVFRQLNEVLEWVFGGDRECEWPRGNTASRQISDWRQEGVAAS